MNQSTILSFKKPAIPGRVSVIIPVYKDVEGLRDTLESIQQNEIIDFSVEVIVGNDGASQQISQLCSAFGVIVVEINPNQGSYTARNAALELSSGEYIAFVDADITVSREWLKKGIGHLQQTDYVGGAVFIDKTKLKTWAHYFEYATAFNNTLKLEKYHYIPTANLFVKRCVFEAVGGFDRRLWSGGDVEFGNRVFDSLIYSMEFESSVYVLHPPRGYRSLVKKVSRTMNGEAKLREVYPGRFEHTTPTVITPLRLFIQPLFKILKSNKISLTKKIELVPFALWFGIISLKNFNRTNHQN